MTGHDKTTSESFEPDCLFNWMRFLSSSPGRYLRAGLSINVYGQGDESYLVIEREVSKAPKAVAQYLLHTQAFGNPLMALVNVLKEFKFEIPLLVSKLMQLNYDEDGHARLEGIDVYFSLIKEYDSNDEERFPMTSPSKKSPKAATTAVVFKKRKFDANPDKDARSIEEIVKSISPFDDKSPPTKPANVEEFDEWE